MQRHPLLVYAATLLLAFAAAHLLTAPPGRLPLALFTTQAASTVATPAQSTDTHILVPIVSQGRGQAAPVPTPTPPAQPVRTGIATWYHATGAGNCSFDPSPDDLLVAALNTPDYGGARLCGAFLHVQGPAGSVQVRVVDRCPGCAVGHVDLSREAFARIAALEQGVVDITWQVVSPEMTGPISYHFKEGSNQYWSAIQVRNHRNPVATLEYRASDGTFRPLGRELYNYFVEPAGMGPGPYTVRVTDIYGHQIVSEQVPFTVGGEAAGGGQFPAP